MAEMRLFSSCPTNSGHTGFVLLHGIPQTNIMVTKMFMMTMMIMMMKGNMYHTSTKHCVSAFECNYFLGCFKRASNAKAFIVHVYKIAVASKSLETRANCVFQPPLNCQSLPVRTEQ